MNQCKRCGGLIESPALNHPLCPDCLLACSMHTDFPGTDKSHTWHQTHTCPAFLIFHDEGAWCICTRELREPDEYDHERMLWQQVSDILEVRQGGTL